MDRHLLWDGRDVRDSYAARAVSVCLGLAVACGNKSGPVGSTAPTTVAPVVKALSVSPSETGLENATEFTFTADTSNVGESAMFTWEFGDGSSTSGGATVKHVFARSGTFDVRVKVTNAAGEATASITVHVASLVGTWQGTVTGHTGFPWNRPIPITSFELRLYQPLPAGVPGADTALSAYWADDAGCRESRRGFIRGSVGHPRQVKIGIESLLCNDGDFYLDGTADEAVRVVSGTCPLGGPNCRFRMVKQ